MTEITGRIDDSGVKAMFRKLIRNAEQISPALDSIGQVALSAVEQNFEDEGPGWNDLEESTKKQRAKKDKWPGKILQVSGQLASSINKRVQGRSVYIGSNKSYAGIQNEGGIINHPGTSNGFGKGINIPSHSIDIPQREFLEFSEETKRESFDILIDHLIKGTT